MTGDLGKTGFELYKTLAGNKGIDVTENFRDAGAEFYGDDPLFLVWCKWCGLFCRSLFFRSD